jgi:TolB-like protein/DNA-binding winged helix-turn-helix (wHTH) protein/Tfp pilus assembly protein PilF
LSVELDVRLKFGDLFAGRSNLSEAPVQTDVLELDLRRYELRRGHNVLKLEKIPMELLILLVERRDQLVGREEIVARLWGKDVFLDTEQGVNTAIRKIRLTLGDDPDQPRFLQTVVGKGYRFVGPINVVGAAPAVVQPSAPVSVIEEEARRSRPRTIPRWVVKASVAALILIGVVAMAVKYFDWDRWLPRPPVHSIAVLPLKNLSGNPSDEYFTDGMTDELITNLAKISALRVSSYTSVSKYKTTSKSLPQVAQELQVDGIVEGSVLRSGDQVRITAQLIYAPRDQHLWAEEYQRYLRDVLYLQREVARDIAQQVRVTLTPNERQRLATAGAVDPAAYESYLRGRSFWNQRSEASLLKAIDQFNKAIEVDAGYAPAYSGLADCYTTLGYLSYLDPLDAFPRARDAATKALELDPSLAEAHTSLAYYNLYHAWNWAEAENEFKKAIELNPNYATAHDWYSYYLMAMGRFDEAWKEVSRAHELDPLSVIISTDIGFNYYYQRNYDGAISQLRGTLSISPKFPLAHLWLGRAYQQKKMYSEAINEFNKTDAALPGWVVTIAGMGNAYGEWGHRAEAEQVLVRLNEMARAKYVTPYGMALVYAALGDKNQAFIWLNRAVEGRSHWLVWLNRDPRWDRLRSDPRFADLKKHVGLPQS